MEPGALTKLQLLPMATATFPDGYIALPILCRHDTK